MQFDQFLHIIQRIQSESLLGIKAHRKMAPSGRPLSAASFKADREPRKAAVLALFYPGPGNHTNFLLIKRAEYEGTHASQIGFPGGKYEDSDSDLTITALRETEEEVGVRARDIIVKKELSDLFIPPSNFLVRPYLGITEYRPEFKANHEVEGILEVELVELLSDSSVKTRRMSTSYMKNIEVPCFHLQNRIVWGATAMMLSEIKELIKLNYH